MKKYLIFGDLAAHFDEFLKAVNSVSKDTVIIVLGDIPDRGSQAKQLIEYLMSHPNIVWVMGNHELIMVDCYNHIVHGSEISPLHNLPYWIFMNGGDATLRSYGVDVEYLIPNDPKATRQFIKQSSWVQIYNLSQGPTIKKITDQFYKIPQAHIDHMRNLPLVFENEDVVCTHAPVVNWNSKSFFDINKILSGETVENNVLWNRNLPSKLRDDNKFYVYGHCHLEKVYAQTLSKPEGTVLTDLFRIPKDLKSICLDISGDGYLLALEYPSMKVQKIKL